MVNPILKLENVSKTVSDSFSLKNINLELRRGEVHAIIGENGSGKSTLLNLLAGFSQKDSGNIYIDNNLVDINSHVDAIKNGIFMTHQEPSVFDHFTVAENIFFDNNIYSKSFFKTINWPKTYYICDQLLKKLDLNIDSHQLVKNIGNAQKHLIEIARAYISKSRIILLDEPTSYFTEKETNILFNIIKELKKEGVTFLYVSHRLEELKQISDRITVIRNGEVIITENVEEIQTSKIISFMTGLSIKERYPKLDLRRGREVLRLENISISNTLKNINLSLSKKEILGITGLAGSGKSKIAKLIFGVDKIESGNIYIEGTRKNISSPLDAIKEGIGYVPEDRQIEGLFMYLKIFENISSSSLKQISNSNILDIDKEMDIAKNFVDKLDIKSRNIAKKVVDLSGGNQQKVILAKWMLSKSKIFILDEPTRGIDIPSKVDVYNMMNELVRKGASILMISSDIDELLGMCDRIIVLYSGNVAATLSKKDANHENIMYYATGGKIV